MRRNSFLFASALAALFGAVTPGVAAGAPTVISAKALPAPPSIRVAVQRARQIGGGTAGCRWSKWPYGGKNRSQRRALDVAFFG